MFNIHTIFILIKYFRFMEDSMKKLVIAVLSVVVAACGGGSGGDSTTSASQIYSQGVWDIEANSANNLVLTHSRLNGGKLDAKSYLISDMSSPVATSSNFIDLIQNGSLISHYPSYTFRYDSTEIYNLGGRTFNVARFMCNNEFISHDDDICELSESILQNSQLYTSLSNKTVTFSPGAQILEVEYNIRNRNAANTPTLTDILTNFDTLKKFGTFSKDDITTTLTNMGYGTQTTYKIYDSFCQSVLGGTNNRCISDQGTIATYAEYAVVTSRGDDGYDYDEPVITFYDVSSLNEYDGNGDLIKTFIYTDLSRDDDFEFTYLNDTAVQDILRVLN